MDGSVLQWVARCGMASLAIWSGAACAQVTPSFGLGSYRLAEVIAPAHNVMAGSATNLNAYPVQRDDSPVQSYSGEFVDADDDDRVAGQSRSWGVTVGVAYGAWTLRGAHQNRHVTNIRLFDQTGVNFDAKKCDCRCQLPPRLGHGVCRLQRQPRLGQLALVQPGQSV